MTDIICLVRSDGTAYIFDSTNPVDAFENFHRRWDDTFLPVAALECDPEAFARVTGWEPPIRVPLRAAARVFGKIGISDGAVDAFQRQLRRLGGASVPLSHEWHRAVQAAKGVGDLPEIQSSGLQLPG